MFREAQSEIQNILFRGYIVDLLHWEKSHLNNDFSALLCCTELGNITHTVCA